MRIDYPKPGDQLSIVLWNVEGLSNLNEFLGQLTRHEFHFLCLCETWYTSKMSVHPTLRNSYSVIDSVAIRERSRGRASGGLAIYYLNQFTARVLDVSPWWIICQFFCQSVNFVLCLVYFKPSLELNMALEMFQLAISEVLESHRGVPIIICGDFNARVGSLGESFSEIIGFSDLHEHHASLDIVRNGRGVNLLDFMNINSFILLNGRTCSDHPAHFTYCSMGGKSAIDLFWCSAGDISIVSDLRVLDDCLCPSAHFPVQMHLYYTEKINCVNPGVDSESGVVFKWYPSGRVSYSSAMALMPEVSLVHLNSQESFLNLTSAIRSVACDVGMVGRRGRPGGGRGAQPWFNYDLRSRKKAASKLLKVCRSHDFTEPYLSDYLNAKREYRKVVRQRKLDHERTLVQRLSSSRNQTQFWRTLQGFRRERNVSVISLDRWEEFYSNLASERSLRSQVLFHDAADPYLDTPVTFAELSRVLSRTPHGRAPGTDGLSYEFFRFLPQNWVLYLCNLFNKIFDLGTMPTEWQEVSVVMLHKRGPTDDPENYRGIALVNCILKVFSLVLLERLLSWSDSNDVLPEVQSGFRKGRGCLDNVFILSSVIQLHLRLQGRKVYAAFVDFRRAFDGVCHQLLWQKLYHGGISAKIIRFLQCLYGGANFRVRVNNHHSRPFDVVEGVLQGEPLSPFLFSMFIIDIENYFRDRGVAGINIDNYNDLLLLLYADDLVILSDAPGDLQRKLVLLEQYSVHNQLEVNVSKSKIVCFRRSPRVPDNLSFKFAGKKLEMVNSYNYLGVVFSSSSLFFEMSSSAVNKTAMCTGSVMSLMSRSKIISWNSRITLYESMVLNSISHCIGVWGLRYPALLERGQVRFFKNLLHLPRCTPDFAVRLESGMLPLSFLIFKMSLSWLEKVLSLRENRLPRMCFNRLRQLENVDVKYNWTLQVRQFFSRLGKLHLWNDLSVHTLKRLKPDLLAGYAGYLRTLDTSAASASSFMLFPSLFVNNIHPSPADYLTWNLPIYVVRSVAQIRLCNIRGIVFSSQGNFFKIDPSVNCSLCNLQRRETIFHIFSECPVYRSIRSEFIADLCRGGCQEGLKNVDLRQAKQIAFFVAAMLRIRAFIINE